MMTSHELQMKCYMLYECQRFSNEDYLSGGRKSTQEFQQPFKKPQQEGNFFNLRKVDKI